MLMLFMALNSRTFFLQLHTLQFLDKTPTISERKDPKNSERAINEQPIKGNTPYRSGNESPWKYGHTSDHTKFNNPDILYRVSYWPYEGNSNYYMSKSKPIGSLT